MLPEDFITAYQNALAAQQWSQVEPLLHPSACVTFSTGAVHCGIAAIEAAYTKNFALIEEEKFAITDVHWVIKNDTLAVYLFRYAWSGIINQQAASGSGRGTATLVCENGKWLLLAEQLGAGE
jgi:hypothetical protein